MEYFKQVFLKLLEYLKITGNDAFSMTDEFMSQVNGKFVEEYLAKKLPAEQLNTKVEEYKKLLTENKMADLQSDLKKFLQNPQEIGEVYAYVFAEHIKAFLNEMHKEGEIKQEEFVEIQNLLQSTSKNVNLQFKMDSSMKQGKIEDVLKSIAN